MVETRQGGGGQGDDEQPDDGNRGRSGALGEIRQQLDVLDRALIDVLAERSLLIGEVIRYKRAHAMPVVDRAREEDMLEHIELLAVEQNLDPRIARRVLRAVIDAFTLLEVEELGPDELDPRSG